MCPVFWTLGAAESGSLFVRISQMKNAAAWNGMPLRFSCLRSDGAALKE
jgi:hypothetical protein